MQETKRAKIERKIKFFMGEDYSKELHKNTYSRPISIRQINLKKKAILVT
ncbi:hypothetical protein GCM10011414_03030 [Croceivirga lutea]|nr:hypothetical protein GCM10011414_03030 [Croceivirga lutea]